MRTLALALAASLAAAPVAAAEPGPPTETPPSPAPAGALAPPSSAERAYLKAVHTRQAAWALLGVGVATLATGASLYGVSQARYTAYMRDAAAFNAAAQAGSAEATPAKFASLQARAQEYNRLELSGAWIGLFGVATLAGSLAAFLIGEDPAGIRPLGREPSAVEWSLLASPWNVGLAARF